MAQLSERVVVWVLLFKFWAGGLVLGRAGASILQEVRRTRCRWLPRRARRSRFLCYPFIILPPF